MYLRTVVAAVIVAGLVIGVAAQAQDRRVLTLPTPNATLSADERARAILIGAAEVASFVAVPLNLPAGAAHQDVDDFAAAEFRKLGTDQTEDRRIVVTGVVALADKDEQGRRALVTLYKYDTGETVQRVVDLATNEVLGERVSATLTPPLAPVERAAVRQLVRADEPLTEMLKEAKLFNTRVEAVAFAAAAADDPLHAHRTAEVMFATERGYAWLGRRVFVDLTENRVFTEEPRQ
jgi:hypothetical protein